MRAAVFKHGKFEITSVPDPIPKGGQLLVSPLATGICGSDLHLYEQMKSQYDAAPEEQRSALPEFILGHEFAAEIVEVGPDVSSRFRPGMRVTANPFTHGPDGPACVGLSPEHSGGLASLSVVDAVRAIEIPDAVPSNLAALTEPLATGLHAARRADRQTGPSLVIGCGPVGLAVIVALRAEGRGPILAADFSPQRRAKAEQLGADIVIDPAVDSPYECWSDLQFSPSTISPLLDGITGRPQGVNVFECVGVPGIIDQVIVGAPIHSHIVVVGVCMHEDKITPLNAIQKELTVEFSCAYSQEEFSHALEHIARYPELAAGLISSERPLEEVGDAIASLADSDPTEIKVLILPNAG